MKRPKPALRVELLFYLTFLVAFALLVGVATSQLALAISPERGVVLVVTFVALEVGIFVLYGRSLVTRLVLRPLARVMDTADGGADHEVMSGLTRELERVARSVRSLLHYARPR